MIWEYDAVSRGSRPWRGRGTSAARSTSGGTAEQARAANTQPPTLSAAAKVSTAVTTAIVHSGSAQRTDQPSRSMSLLVRVRRSPDPAASTVPTGRARVF